MPNVIFPPFNPRAVRPRHVASFNELCVAAIILSSWGLMDPVIAQHMFPTSKRVTLKLYLRFMTI